MIPIVITCLSLLLQLLFYALLGCILLILGFKLYYEPVTGICKCKTKLNGKTVLITGGNTGIGYETAKDLAQRGARVVIACRDKRKAEEAIVKIVNESKNDKVEYMELDLSKFESIKKFAKEFNDKYERLDILVNNAGCAGLNRKITNDGIQIIIQVNHMGPFLLTNLLLDKLKASGPSRIVIVSSLAHKFTKLDINDIAEVNRELSYHATYANSKLLNVVWAKALAKRLPNNVTVNSLHPGVVSTDIFRHLPDFFRKVLLKGIELMFKSSKEGAQTSIHLCVAPELEFATGGYYADCKPSDTSKSINDDLVEKVWEECIRLTSK